MKNQKVIIMAQVYENKAFYEGGESWRPKMGQTFELRMDADFLLYCESECIKAFKELLLEQSNEAMRYEYLSYVIFFHEDIVLESEDFEKKLNLIREKVESEN